MSSENVKSAPLTKIEALKLFYSMGIEAIPIVDKGGRIVAVMQKSDVVASTVVVEAVSSSIKELIRECSTKEREGLLQVLLKGFVNSPLVPVMDVEGKVVDFWSKVDVIMAWEGLMEEGSASSWSILEQLPQAVLVIDKEGKIVYRNQAAKKIFEDFKDEDIILFLKNVQVPSHAQKINFAGQHLIFDAVPLLQHKERVGIVYTFYEQKDFSTPLAESLRMQERSIIEAALQQSGGCVSKCAKLLKVPRQTLQYKMKKLGIKDAFS
jgi:transcriptional regulator with PAS, ATPase and Fis domain